MWIKLLEIETEEAPNWEKQKHMIIYKDNLYKRMQIYNHTYLQYIRFINAILMTSER